MEVAYKAIINTTVDPVSVPPTVLEELEESYLPTWAENSLYTDIFLDMVLPSDEAILEAMSGWDKIYKDIHDKSYFLP